MAKHLILILGGIVGAGIITWMMVGHNTAEAPVPIEEVASSTVDEIGVTATGSIEILEETTPPKSVVDAEPVGKTFVGTLTKVQLGCFVDGECYAVVDGKYVTLTLGWRQEVLGSIKGATSIGDLESYIGETATVYAKLLPNGTYTLYGDEDYYLAVSPKSVKGCVVGGCSSQMCVEEGTDAVSTCEWREQYACYRTAVCERQVNGQCGWTDTTELRQCLADTNSLNSR